jgi:hypothetical protein
MTEIIAFPKENRREELRNAARQLLTEERRPKKRRWPLVVATAVALGAGVPLVLASVGLGVSDVRATFARDIQALRPWTTLTREEKGKIIGESFVRFPEIVGYLEHEKYRRVSAWLALEKGVLYKNVRDLYTAGGRGTIRTRSGTFTDVRHVLMVLANNLQYVASSLRSTGSDPTKWKNEVIAQLDEEEIVVLKAILAESTF